MSLCYILVCRRDLPERPGGWSPFELEGATVARVEPTSLAPGLRRQIDDGVAAVLEVSGSSRVDWALVDKYLRLLADLTQGDLFFEDGWERLYSSPGIPTAAPPDLDARWQEIRRAHVAALAAAADRERAAYARMWRDDPEGMQAASDWSEVMPDVEPVAEVLLDLVLQDAGPRPMAVIKALREIRPDLTIAEARALVKSGDVVVLTRASAEALGPPKDLLEAAGARTRTLPSAG